MSYTIEWEQQLFLITFCGTATADELTSAVQEIQENPFYKLAKYTLVDFLSVEQVDANVLNIVKHADGYKKVASEAPNRKVAIVADQPDIVRLAKLYKWEMVGQQWQAEVFETLDEARNWIAEDSL